MRELIVLRVFCFSVSPELHQKRKLVLLLVAVAEAVAVVAGGLLLDAGDDDRDLDDQDREGWLDIRRAVVAATRGVAKTAGADLDDRDRDRGRGRGGRCLVAFCRRVLRMIYEKSKKSKQREKLSCTGIARKTSGLSASSDMLMRLHHTPMTGTSTLTPSMLNLAMT